MIVRPVRADSVLLLTTQLFRTKNTTKGPLPALTKAKFHKTIQSPPQS